MLKIFFTTDIHGFFFPTDYLDNDEKDMGLFKMAGDFQKDGDTLIIDGGDALQGSAFTRYCQKELGKFDIVADIMNKCQYDFVTLGNHDFNYGMDSLRRFLGKLDAICVCQNISDDNGDILFPYVIRKMSSGLIVGVVGITTDYVQFWEKSENLAGIKFINQFEAARQALSEIKNQVDITICVYHGGFEKDLETGRLLSKIQENIACRICRELEFDILLTGHQHSVQAGRFYEGTYIIQPPHNGKGYAYFEIEKDSSGLKIKSELRGAGNVIDQGMFGEFADTEDRIQQWLNESVGTLPEALPVDDRVKMALNGSPLAGFFNNIQLYYSGAQLSAINFANDLSGLPKDVRRRDLFASYPHPNTFVLLEITGAQLRSVVERSAEYLDYDENGQLVIAESFLRPKIAHYYYDFYAGIDISLDYRLPKGGRVISLTCMGKPVQEDDVFTICVDNYRATGAGGYNAYSDCKVLKLINTEMVDLIVDYFNTTK